MDHPPRRPITRAATSSHDTGCDRLSPDFVRLELSAEAFRKVTWAPGAKPQFRPRRGSMSLRTVTSDVSYVFEARDPADRADLLHLAATMPGKRLTPSSSPATRRRCTRSGETAGHGSDPRRVKGKTYWAEESVAVGEVEAEQLQRRLDDKNDVGIRFRFVCAVGRAMAVVRSHRAAGFTATRVSTPDEPSVDGPRQGRRRGAH